MNLLALALGFWSQDAHARNHLDRAFMEKTCKRDDGAFNFHLPTGRTRTFLMREWKCAGSYWDAGVDDILIQVNFTRKQLDGDEGYTKTNVTMQLTNAYMIEVSKEAETKKGRDEVAFTVDVWF